MAWTLVMVNADSIVLGEAIGAALALLVVGAVVLFRRFLVHAKDRADTRALEEVVRHYAPLMDRARR